MSALSRRKGASYEREIVNILKSSGRDCARNLDQVRDGGGDIPFGDWLIECKRRASISIYQWWDQVVSSSECQLPEPLPSGRMCRRPLLIVRADKRENLVVMRLTDFIDLISQKDKE